MKGSDAMAQTLIKFGIKHIFSIPSDSIHPLVTTMYHYRDQIQHVTAMNEGCLAAMAEGYARALRKPTFVNVYQSTGTAYALFALHTAWADGTPLILTTTSLHRELDQLDQYCTIPGSITDLTRQYTKWSWEVPIAERIPEAIARAYTIATTPPMGPVHLAFPMDLYEDEVGQVDIPEPERMHVYARTPAQEEGVRQAAELLARAERPVVVTGSEVGLSGATEELIGLAELLAIPVVSEPYVAYRGFPPGHDLNLGGFAQNRDVVDTADVVLNVGAQLTAKGFQDDRPAMPKSARVVHISASPWELGKSSHVDVGLLADIGTGLTQITEHVRKLLRPEDREGIERRRIETTERKQSKAAPDSAAGTVQEGLKRSLPKDAIIVDQATSSSRFARDFVKDMDDRNYFGISGKASCLGWGLPAAIGMQMALPDRKVVAMLGDGNFMWTPQALWAAVTYKTPILAFVFNNGGMQTQVESVKEWGLEDEPDLRPYFNYSWEAAPVRCADMAQSMGVWARRVEDPKDVAPVVEEAQKVDGPALIEIMVQARNAR